MLLEINGLTKRFGGLVAVENISLRIAPGEVVSIIGANGAGKSTILRGISGLTPITSGSIWFEGKQVNGMGISDIVSLGLVHIPEGRKLFPYLPVMTNLRLGASLRKDKAAIARDMEAVFEHFPVLRVRSKQNAGTLSGGEQQMLAIGRGLMADPRLLLMDEPSLGLAPIMMDALVPVIQNINRKGVSVLLVEQNIPLALRVAHRGYTLQVGRVVLEGEIDLFRSNEILSKAYLGGK